MWSCAYYFFSCHGITSTQLYRTVSLYSNRLLTFCERLNSAAAASSDFSSTQPAAQIHLASLYILIVVSRVCADALAIIVSHSMLSLQFLNFFFDGFYNTNSSPRIKCHFGFKHASYFIRIIWLSSSIPLSYFSNIII